MTSSAPSCRSCAADGRRVEPERDHYDLARETVFDPVTSVANRRTLVERLARVLRDGEGSGQAGLLMLDVDDFSSVNEMLGHSAGDALLEALARRLVTLVEADDTVARISADTFCLLAEGVGDADALARLDARLGDALVDPFMVDGYSLVVRASCGFRLARRGENPETVLRDAEEALSTARRSRRGQSVLFNSAGPTRVDRRRLEMDLRRALSSDEVICYFQPVIDVADGHVVGAEALVRWCHPERGMIAPEAFISAAEESGIVDLLTDRVLAVACTQAARWRQDGGPPILMHVNLSGHDLADPRLPARVLSALEGAGLPAEGLCLEITESVLVSNEHVAQGNLDALRRCGVRFAIDDFGVEYASFGYLRKFPVEVLKIDRSFVEHVASDPRDRAVLGGIVGLAQALGMTTVAEGVETEAQAEIVREIGVDEAQGWYYGRPRPGDQWCRPLG